MAPVKPLGVSTPKGSKPGVTGFVQEYNQEPGPRQDLNPDAVTDPSVLPPPLPTSDSPRASRTRIPRAARVTKPRKANR